MPTLEVKGTTLYTVEPIKHASAPRTQDGSIKIAGDTMFVFDQDTPHLTDTTIRLFGQRQPIEGDQFEPNISELLKALSIHAKRSVLLALLTIPYFRNQPVIRDNIAIGTIDSIEDDLRRLLTISVNLDTDLRQSVTAKPVKVEIPSVRAEITALKEKRRVLSVEDFFARYLR